MMRPDRERLRGTIEIDKTNLAIATARHSGLVSRSLDGSIQ